ncbi:hypothetical protein Tco_0229175, partial [Tanacetum coccineum]
IKEINEGASDPDKKKKFVKEDVSTKVHAKQDEAKEGTNKRKGSHMKMLARKRKRPQPDVDNDDEHRKCLKIVTFEGTIDSEIIERKSVTARLNKQYSEVTQEGIELILWGDLKIMMESSQEETDQKLKDGTIIHMLVKRRYPLSKDLLQRMLDLRLEVERESTA